MLSSFQVKAKFADAQITITGDGSISAEQIDAEKLIDVHYYAIASKAVLKKPHELNVPADRFEKQFGLGWQEALNQGKNSFCKPYNYFVFAKA